MSEEVLAVSIFIICINLSISLFTADPIKDIRYWDVFKGLLALEIIGLALICIFALFISSIMFLTTGEWFVL